MDNIGDGPTTAPLAQWVSQDSLICWECLELLFVFLDCLGKAR